MKAACLNIVAYRISWRCPLSDSTSMSPANDARPATAVLWPPKAATSLGRWYTGIWERRRAHHRILARGGERVWCMSACSTSHLTNNIYPHSTGVAVRDKYCHIYQQVRHVSRANVGMIVGQGRGENTAHSCRVERKWSVEAPSR